MTRGRWRVWSFVGLAALAGWAVVPAEARAAELCVTCTEPQQTYRCRVEGPQAGLEEAMRLACIVRTAKDGGHRSCAVSAASDGPCAGPVKIYTLKGLAVPQALRDAREHSRQDQEQIRLPSDAPPLAAPKPKDGQPKTLVEMTGKTGKKIGKLGKKAGQQVGETAVDTGSAIGRAARFTYDCLKSLFRNCSRSDR